MKTSSLKPFALAAVLAAAAFYAPSTAASAAHQQYAVSQLGPGPLVIANNAAVNGLTVGGLSGITHAGGDKFYAITDNQGSTPARFYTLNFHVSSAGVSLTQQPLVSDVTTLAGYNGQNFDGEGISLTNHNTLLISSETEPAIREFDLSGNQVQTLPTPSQFPFSGGGGAHGIQFNLAFESLTQSPDGGVVWTANERSLGQDATTTSAIVDNQVRLVRFTKNGAGYVNSAQYVYDIAPYNVPAGNFFATKGLVDMQVLPDGTLITMERSYRADTDKYEIKVYQVDFDNATDVSGLDSLVGQTYTGVHKKLLYDFADANFAPDNIEGIAFGPILENGDQSLVVISDNNFNGTQHTQIAALRLQAVPEPSALLALTLGLAMLAIAVLRRRSA
ncbi:MAG: esterase-like activity of phytase family protein [Capsulimonas sp.]|uniref:esterase-like activity of phytase family protein n=1 Tax=Capsulimonas sp. TaxID=2494211 RepID=UPI00326544B8